MNRTLHLIAAMAVVACGAVTAIAAPTSAYACGCTASSIHFQFNDTPIPTGDYVWFSSVVSLSNVSSYPVTIQFKNVSIDGVPSPRFNPHEDVAVPDATVTITNGGSASTSYDSSTNTWNTTAPAGSGNVFLDGVAVQVPSPGGWKGRDSGPTWTGTFYTSDANVEIHWKWAAAAYSTFSTDYNSLGVVPVDGTDLAGTPASYATGGDLVSGATGDGGANWTGSFSCMASACGHPTLALVSRFTAAFRRNSGRVVLQWRVDRNASIAGFNAFAGSRKLNAELIRTHRASGYTFTAKYTGTSRYRLEVIMLNGASEEFAASLKR